MLTRSVMIRSANDESTQIPLDCKIIGSFVHRLHPSNISTILLEGSAIYRELIIVPVFPPLPVYADIFTETAAQPNALCARKDSRSELFRTFYYLRYSRYSRMLKRRHSNFHWLANNKVSYWYCGCPLVIPGWLHWMVDGGFSATTPHCR